MSEKIDQSFRSKSLTCKLFLISNPQSTTTPLFLTQDDWDREVRVWSNGTEGRKEHAKFQFQELEHVSDTFMHNKNAIKGSTETWIRNWLYN